MTPTLDRATARLARIRGDTTEPVAANDAARTELSPAAFARLESLPGYWRGRAQGRQAAVDFYRGEACQRDVTPGVDVGHDALRDHAMIAEYEKRAGV